MLFLLYIEIMLYVDKWIIYVIKLKRKRCLMNIKIGDTLVIHCYKHNGVIHKSWKLAYVLDIKEDYIVLGNENVLVTKQDGRTWHTKNQQ